MEIILQLLHMTKRLLNIQKLAEEHNIPRDQFEFQMLYGIRNERQLELVKKATKCVFTYLMETTGMDISCVV